MRRLPIRLAAGVLLVAGAAALAADGHNRYRWQDANGAVHYGDVLPADAAKFGYDVLNEQGIVVRRVERAKTPEERAAEAALAKRAEAERREAERRAREDRQLLATYPTEADLVRSQEQELGQLDRNLAALGAELESLESALAEQLDAAADLERNKEAVPERLGEQIAELRRRIADQRDYIARRQAERNAAEAGFAEERSRYRDLRSAAASR